MGVADNGDVSFANKLDHTSTLPAIKKEEEKMSQIKTNFLKQKF